MKIREQKSAMGDGVHTLVTAALLAALTCGATMALRVPSPTGGYMNLGDAVVLLGAFLLGPWYGALSAGVGSALADALGGYAAYAPATLGIKALMGVTAGSLHRFLRGRRGEWVLPALAGEVPMVAGYWLFDGVLLGSLKGAAAGIFSNLAQGGFGVAVGVCLATALGKSAYVRSRFPDL